MQQKKALEQAVEALGRALAWRSRRVTGRFSWMKAKPSRQLLYQAIERGLARLMPKSSWLRSRKTGRHRRCWTEKPAQKSLLEPLSEREQEVLALIAGGLSNREICLAPSHFPEHSQRARGQYLRQIGGQQPYPGDFGSRPFGYSAALISNQNHTTTVLLAGHNHTGFLLCSRS